jgi:hypothetical protein
LPKTTRGRIEMADHALRLRDEQLRARVVYVDPNLKTNAELDAITAQVVAELQEMQVAGLKAAGALDPQQMEIELIKGLRELLEKMLSPRREQFLRHKIELIQRRIVQLYYTSEVQGSPDQQGPRERYNHGGDALTYVLRQLEPQLLSGLQALTYREPKVMQDAIETMRRFTNELVSNVLARSRPDLEKLLVIYRDVLLDFLMRDFNSQLGEFAWEVLRESRAAKGENYTYKIREKDFTAFRHAFERRFLEHLLGAVHAPLSQRMQQLELREETVRFAADPRIYADICAVTCNAIYDFLHGEGYLDLPVDWQAHLAKVT